MSTKIIGRVAAIGAMKPEDFRLFEGALVRLYRTDPDAQEALAIALTRANLSVADPVTRSRLDEIFAMLQHVHDPFISAVIADDEPLQVYA